jgi:hypothetical protein
MTQGPSPVGTPPRTSRRADPEPLRTAAEHARAVGRLISPHATRDTRELRDLDRRLSAFARQRPRVGVAGVQRGSGASTVSRLIGRTHSGRAATESGTVEDFGAGRLSLDDLTALFIVTKAELDAIPATRDFVTNLGEQRRSALPRRVIVVVVVNQLRPATLTTLSELRLGAAVRDLRRSGLFVVSLAHDPELAHGSAERPRWAPRTRLAALRLGAAALGGVEP